MQKGNVAVFSLTNPGAFRDGGTLRARQLVNILRNEGLSPEIVCQSPHAPLTSDVRESRLRKLKRKYIPMPTSIGAFEPRMMAEARRLAPDLSLVTVLPHMQYANKLDAPIWLDLMDVWSDFAKVEAHARRGISRATAGLQSKLLKLHEKRASGAAALVTCVGWEDYLNLTKRGIECHWSPTTLPDVEFVPSRNRETQKAGLIGNFRYWPNVDSYHLMIREWLPTLRSLGYGVIVGGIASDELAPIPSGVELVGEIADLSSFYNNIDFSLAPIRLGGGMKVKVIESLARGKSVLGTEFAFRGFPPELRRMCHIFSHSSAGTIVENARVDPFDSALLPFRESSSQRVLGQMAKDLIR